MIPEFDPETGYLPYGVHDGVYDASWDEFRIRYDVSFRRSAQLVGMKKFFMVLKDVNCKSVIIDGSFVTDKLIPGDYDGTWDTEGVDWSLLLSSTWFQNKEQMQKEFQGELYAADTTELDTNMLFGEFFQIDEWGRKKGVVRISLDTVS